MKAIALALALGVCAAETAPKSEDVQFVEMIVNAPIDSLTPSHVKHFMGIDEKTLPPKLRLKYQSRKVELHTLKQLTGDKKKGFIRTPEKDCEIPSDAKSGEAAPLAMAGFMEIQDDEEDMLLKKTQCTERELMCESSLQIVVERDKKTNKVLRRRYYLHPGDPLTALVAGFRAGNNIGGNTNFFGRSNMLCSH